MKTSQAGLDLIKRNEGCELTAYLDTLARPPVWTIGYGDTQNVREGLRITPKEAEDRLARRLANEFEPGVTAALAGAPVTQDQFDALVSLAWNIGVGGVKGSSVILHHRTGDYALAADAFRLWNKAGGRVIPGLVRRREEERALYLSGSAPEGVAGLNEEIANAVKLTQTLLVRRRLYPDEPGWIDGIPGPATLKALEEWQRLR